MHWIVAVQFFFQFRQVDVAAVPGSKGFAMLSGFDEQRVDGEHQDGRQQKVDPTLVTAEYQRCHSFVKSN
jgi:hypothetical protein